MPSALRPWRVMSAGYTYYVTAASERGAIRAARLLCEKRGSYWHGHSDVTDDGAQS